MNLSKHNPSTKDFDFAIECVKQFKVIHYFKKNGDEIEVVKTDEYEAKPYEKSDISEMNFSFISRQGTPYRSTQARDNIS